MAKAEFRAGVQPQAVRRLFVATILLGSFLLFLMQPLVARLALPRLGGAPAVWNSAMLVYQALLLAGYAYAHALGRLAPRGQALVHFAVLAAALLWLPIGLLAIVPPADANPALWVPWLLALSIGPLFFAIAAQAPLMQRWFTYRHPGANPYPLYAASNLGSFAGLVAYPLLVEPLLRLKLQSWLWSGGYMLLLALVGAAATTLPRRAATVAVHAPATLAPRLGQWLGWILFAAVPSGLMLSTTTHLTTDIVAMPLLWVLPLGLYLLSFSIAFADDRRAATALGRAAPALMVVAGSLAFAIAPGQAMLSALLGLALLFAVAVALHAEMYRRRPDPAHLTAFYLAMAIGGVVGGLFSALLAPILFDWVYEHPVLILAAALLVPQRPIAVLGRLWQRKARSQRLTIWLAAGCFILSLVCAGLVAPSLPLWLRTAAGLAVGAAAFAAIGRRKLFAALLGLTMLAFGGWNGLSLSLTTDARTRSYFGVYTVADSGRAQARLLFHGTTIHGSQRLVPGHSRDATSYYAPLAGVGLAMRAAPNLFGPAARIGVVGLGAGTLACYARPGQDWRFYEIDPAVAAIARDTAKFTFLSQCTPHAPILIGDARLVLAREPSARFDLLVVDAFSSDAVPAHLLTREAFAVYRRTLRPGGLLVINITNRYVDLEPVLAAEAARHGWSAALREYRPDRAALAAGAARSVWVALSPSNATLVRLTQADPAGWRGLRARPGMAPWSDDFASILPLLRIGGARR